METKFRPIPITILDILAIFLPGFVWLVLIATAFELVRHLDDGKIPTPLLAWEDIVESLRVANTWFAPFPLLVVSLLLGYLLKPSAIVITEQMASQIAIRLRYKRLLAEEGSGFWKAALKGLRRPRLTFPFNDMFEGNPLYQVVNKILDDKFDCVVSGKTLRPQDFPGSQIFATAKSYLKVTSPTLWEESERREAEVRMAGVMFLAFCFSILLSVLVLFLTFAHGDGKLKVASWLALSVVGAFVAGESFSLLRVSEVGYTYLNVLVADKCTRPAAPDEGGVTRRAGQV